MTLQADFYSGASTLTRGFTLAYPRKDGRTVVYLYNGFNSGVVQRRIHLENIFTAVYPL